jgi:molecular chaperone IbpA
MRTYDFSPLWRSSIGFDRLLDFVEAAQRAGEDNYPPYNIERLDLDRYGIELAVAGFAPEEITVTAEQNVVTVEGTKADGTERNYLHRGISARPFKRQFTLADYVQVRSATFEHGRLSSKANQMSPPASLLNSLKDDIGTTQRLSTPSHGFQCLLVTLRMLVVPLSGSFRRSSLKSACLPFASSLAARFLVASNSAFEDDGMPHLAIASSRSPSTLRTIGAG